MSGIDVSFGGIRALRDFGLNIERGEIHGLIGPNGAGKTTAINVVTGLVRASAGRMHLDGQPFTPEPRKLVQRGIARVFQAPAIFGDMTAIANVLLGAYHTGRTGILAEAVRTPTALRAEEDARTRALDALSRVGYGSSPQAPARSLSYGDHRKIELARALMTGPRLLLLDEPTAGLARAEVAHMGEVLRRLCEGGSLTVLLVEHDVPFVFGLCHRVTALHEGRRLVCGTPAEVKAHAEVVSSYLGGTEGGAAPTRRGAACRPSVAVPRAPIVDERGRRSLDVDDVVSGYGETVVIRGACLKVGEGEVVVLFGRNGAGKSTLLNTIVGSVPARRGEVRWNGERIDRLRPDEIVRKGVGLVPQERSIIARQSVRDNLLLATFALKTSRKERQERLDATLDRFPRLKERASQLAGNLSGGERQMLAIAKALVRKPKLLMLDEPSIGLAPSIVQQLKMIVAELRDEGLSILIAEQSVAWVIPLATRAYLVESGAVAEEHTPDLLADASALADRYLGTTTARPSPNS
ncbi:MAG TPA: ATP-binding cassette domain-containing protein [Candidatus Dormibacteraeota bacterium]|nr:ATP-binding cassette domain-containing protein [Candidatus Dormibacteraeota bacterium]